MSDDVVRLFLLPVLDASTVAMVEDELREAFVKQQPIVVDASTIEHVTTQGVQLLLVAAKHMRQSGLAFHLHAATETLARSFHALGLESAFRSMTTAH